MPTAIEPMRNDPWRDQKDQRPPDLDKLLKQWSDKINRIFGGGGPSNTNPKGTIGLILGILLVGWAASGIYIVRPAEQAAIFRFGKYAETVGPGPHWIARFIESHDTQNVEVVKNSSHTGLMLTKDNTIVSVELAVQYRIGNLKDYLFNVVSPDRSLKQATDSAMRQVIGHSTLNQILTSGRELIRQQIKDQIETVLAQYKAGIEIVDVPMQPAKAPEAVKEAFDDAIKAQEDQQREINKADAYAKRIVPIAQGKAQRLVAEGNAYKEKVILRSKGDVDRFLSVLPEYQRAEKVTRTRLYLDTMESILGKVNKIMIDSKGSNNLFYLPIDKLTQQTKPIDLAKAAETTSATPAPKRYQPPMVLSNRDNSRFASRQSNRH